MNEEQITTQKPAFLDGRDKVDILKLLDELEELIEDRAVHVFHRAWNVSLDEFFTLTNKVRASLPDEVKRASRVANDSDRIVAAAREEADVIVSSTRRDALRIIEEAKLEAARLVDGSEINRLATIQAREIVAGAENSAREMRKGADEYARQVLTGLEDHLERIVDSCQRGREKLEQRLQGMPSQQQAAVPDVQESQAVLPPVRRESYRR